MESAGSPVAYAVGPEDAPELARLLDREGPFVSVTLTTEQQLDNAAQRSQQHWRAVRDDLEAQGASGADLDAIEALVPELHHDGPGAFVVAAGGEVLLSFGLSDAPARDHGSVGTVPSLAPILGWRQSHLPHIVVLADRAGADILAVGPHGDQHTDSAGTKDAGHPHLRKSHPGGWSQRRYEERAENLWDRNAAQVADRVAQIARLLQPAAILVAGDERALWHLRDHLDERLAPLVQQLEGARNADGGDGALAEDVRRALNTVAAADTVALLEKFKEEKGQADRAADGLASTIEALNGAAVDTLLVHDDVDDERRAWFGTDLDVVALDRAGLESYGVQAPQEARLVDVLVRAAFRSGARVRLVPKTVVQDGVGAILRFAT
jgi:hypothetical protein